MPVNNDYFDADMGVIWLQPDGPNTTVYPLFCHNTDGPDEPLGDVTTRMCRTERGWQTVLRSQGLPGESTLSIEARMEKTRSWLQYQSGRRKSMPVYIQSSHCGPVTEFSNYEVGTPIHNAIITSRGRSAMVRGMADAGDGAADATAMTFDLSGEPGPLAEYWPLVITFRTIAEAEPLRDIWMDAQTWGACDCAADGCEVGTIVPDATGPGSSADIWHTTSGWVTGAAGATDPFAVAEDVAFVVRFALDRDTTRIIVGRGTTDAGNPAEIGYSDNAGATWTNVNVGTTNGEYFAHGGAGFALDSKHIWVCTDQGNIFFSSNAGLTWTDQGAPAPAPVEDLLCIRFLDENYGCCVGGTAGASSVFLSTVDGGAHWTLGTGPAANQMSGIAVLDSCHLWATMYNGALYYSNDYGTTWTQRVLLQPATRLGDIDAWDEFNMAICGYRTIAATTYATVWRTVNGGADWEEYRYTGALTASYFGLNAVWMCDPNHIFAVGDVDTGGSVGTILELAPAGATA